MAAPRAAGRRSALGRVALALLLLVQGCNPTWGQAQQPFALAEELDPSRTMMQLIICDDRIPSENVRTLLAHRLPYVEVSAASELPRPLAECCGPRLCSGCSFSVVLPPSRSPHGGTQCAPLSASVMELDNALRPLMSGRLVLRSGLATALNVFVVEPSGVERLLGVLPSGGEHAITGMHGDHIRGRSPSGTVLVDWIIDERPGDVLVDNAEDACEAAQSADPALRCSRPLSPSAELSAAGARPLGNGEAASGVTVAPTRDPLAAEYTIDGAAFGLEAYRSTFTAPRYLASTRSLELLLRRRDDHEERRALASRQAFDVRNRTGSCHAVRALGEEAWLQIRSSYLASKASTVRERWPAASALLNHWESATYKVFLSAAAKRALAAQAQRMVEQWLGERVAPAAPTDVRVYKRGAAMMEHVDQSRKHLFTAIAHVDRAPGGEWPLFVTDRAGVRHEVLLQPGEVLLLESAACLHGRPRPLEGDFFANAFVHMSPLAA